jgi:hypothetical protein
VKQLRSLLACVRTVFMFVDVNRSWRHAKVTDQRTCIDFAECMRDLVDEQYPDAERIRVVRDNPSAHLQAVLYQRFEPAERTRAGSTCSRSRSARWSRSASTAGSRRSVKAAA